MIDVTGLELYVVVNKTGQFFRSKGYGGVGDSWVNDIKKAKVYPKLGSARARVTWFATNYSNYGIPTILKLTVSGAEEIDETTRVKKSQEAKVKKDLLYKQRANEYKLKCLLEKEAEIRKELAALKKD